LTKPEERAAQRLEHPRTLWDVLCGLIVVYWPLLLLAVLTALVAVLRPRFVRAIGEAVVSRKLRRYCAEVADLKTND